MNDSSPTPLPRAVTTKIRIDGAQVAVVKSHHIGSRQAKFSIEELPLTMNSFVELEFTDGTDRLIVPARVTHVDEAQVTLEYEQTGEPFEHWLKLQCER